MRGLVLILVLASAALSVGVREARADKVKTNQATKVYSKAGEQSHVVLTLKSGANMTVIAQKDRWLKVRVQGHTGYVPRSKVDMPDGDELQRNTRRRAFVDGRSTRRGFGGDAPSDRVGDDATGGGGDSGGGSSGGDDDGDTKAAATKSKPSKSTKTKPSKGDDDDGDGDSKSGGKSSKHGDDDDPKISDDGDDKGDDKGEDKGESRPTAHVGGKSTVYNERNKGSGELFVAKPSMVLYPGETKGKWTFVENDDGDGGWILSSQLDLDDRGGGGGNPHKREIDTHARLGVAFLQQGMRTAGSTLMNSGTAFNVDNYNLGTSALSVALGGEVLYPYQKSYVVGVELAYDYVRALPGLHYNMVDTGITIHNLNVRALAGYDLHKKNGMILFGRVGVRYEGFQVDVTNYTDPKQNPALLPSENMYAPTVGAALEIPRLTDKLGMKLALDTYVLGASISQTKALEDGAKPSVKGVTFEGAFRYRWRKDMDLQGMYDLNYGSYDFGAPLTTSMRGHTGTDVTRTDIFHVVTFGIAKGF